MTQAAAPGMEIAGYRLESLIGRGGMGVVYVAEEPSLGRRVALKLLAPELAADASFGERFLREMRLAAALEHPHVLPVYAAGEAEGRLYLALRLVDGEDLGALLLRDGALPPERSLELLRQLASALDAAHAVGLLHRDVKPANVLLAGAGHAYLSDFGLARTADASTVTSALAGTSTYLAPELIEGGRPTPACDRYALACVAYECLAGRPPFVREAEAALLFAHLREPPPPLEAFPEADAVLARALAKAPGERYETCAAFVDALALALDAASRPRAAAPPLPTPPTPLVGRERELGEAEAILLGRGTRLLTLTGPGGTGKTRLALALAERVAHRFRDGARFASLAALADPDLVPSALAAALGVKEDAGAGPREALLAFLGDEELLLFLDNLEQLLEAATFLAELLAACPGLTLLVTSRAPLHLSAEHEYAVPPLADAEATELFRARAAAARPGLELAQDDATVLAIVRRLDGLPLALELAAARLRILDPEALLARLEHALPLLSAGPRDAPSRQQTLRAAIDWSYGLLAEEEQTLFARLSVFAGGFTLEAAEAVAGADLDRLEVLVEQSLLRRREGADGEPRFHMLRVIGEYAAERLATLGEEAARRAHAAWFAELAVRAEPELRGPATGEWLDRLEAEHDNFRSALAWCGASGETELELRLAGPLHEFWHMRGHWAEGSAWLGAAVERGREGAAELRDRVLRGAANFARRQGRLAQSQAYAEERLALAREVGNARSVASSLVDLGVIAIDAGDFERATEMHEESIAVARGIDYPLGLAIALQNLGYLALSGGDLDRADELLREALDLLRLLDNPWQVATTLQNAAFVALERGRIEEAEAMFVEGVRLVAPLGERYVLAVSVLGLAATAAAKGEGERAAGLVGSVDALLEEIGAALEVHERSLRERTLARARELVGEERAHEAHGAGAGVPFERAVDEALG